MKIKNPLVWIGLLLIIAAGAVLGSRWLIPRVLFAPDDPALTMENSGSDPVNDSTSPELPEGASTDVEETPDTTSGHDLEAAAKFPFQHLAFEVEVLAENLNIPWEIRYLPDDDDWLITQRSGELLSLNRGLIASIEGVAHTGEGGLLGMALHPDFSSNRHLYLYYTTQSGSRITNRVMRFRYENHSLRDGVVILDDIPGARFHNGGRIAFGPDGMLYVTTGDAVDPPLSQQESSLAGKILRMTPEGEVPGDNPFPDSLVYSLGHRNPQGMAWHPETEDLYASEHGPTQMDEVNLILPGANYGWPIVTCDEAPTDYEDPIACYAGFTLAPSGMTFYNPGFIEGTPLLVSGLRGNQIRRLSLESDGTVTDQEALFTEWGRIRTVHALDGDLYFITNNRDGRGTPHAEDDRLVRLRVRTPE